MQSPWGSKIIFSLIKTWVENHETLHVIFQSFNVTYRKFSSQGAVHPEHGYTIIWKAELKSLPTVYDALTGSVLLMENLRYFANKVMYYGQNLDRSRARAKFLNAMIHCFMLEPQQDI